MFGGIEALLVTQARFAALEPGLEHEFALGFGGRLEDELVAAGGVIHRYPAPRLSRPWTVLRARARFRDILRRSRPDVVVAHSNWPHVLFGPTARRAGYPIAYWLHDSFKPDQVLDRLSTRTRPDLVVANSRFNAELSLPRQFPGVPWEVNVSASPAPQIADVPAVRARLRRELGTADGAVVIAQTSRLERWKGHAQLLAAAARLRDKAGWEIWLTGGVQRPHEQEFFDELKASAEAAGVADRVKFLGQRSDIPHVLAAADVHCQPNTHPEPLGLTFVEALHAGLPCVSMDFGGAAEIITADCGILVAPGDVEALASALGSLIESPELRARLGAAGPARASELCDPALHLGRLRRMLEPLAARKPRPTPTPPRPVHDPVA